MKKNNTTERLLSLCASPILLHYTLPALMICLIIGTIAQKYIGLYEATRIFFSQIIIWFGPFPLPGMPLILSVIAVNLSGKLIFKSPWSTRKIGIIITHIGALLLLAGGLLTALFSNEGYISIPVGAKSNTISDYHDRELTIGTLKINMNDLNKGKIIEPYAARPLKFEILDICQNCAITKRENATNKHHGMAQHMQLHSAPLKNNNEENMGGVTFMISGAQEDENGIYLVLEDVPKLPELHGQEGKFTVSLQKTTRTLPFTIELLDFKREVYPGTDKPKAFESKIRIHDNGVQWDALISMNAPLRYKGYTFFQSSYISTPNQEISVLAAVWNVGRTFPYIASLTMGLGILVHLIMRGRR